MPVVLAKKQIGRVRPGEKVKVGSNVVRAVLALGMAERIAPVVHAAPVPAAPKLPRQERRAYNRKDVPASPQAGVMSLHFLFRSEDHNIKAMGDEKAAQQAAALAGINELSFARVPGGRSGKMRNIVRAKKALIIVARDQGYSMPTIAKAVNNDHSTISHHLSTARSQLQTDVLMQQYVDKLRTVIDADYAERQRIVLEVSAAARQMRDEALRVAAAEYERQQQREAELELMGLPKMLRSADYLDAGMPRSWWERNNDRFAEAMRRALASIDVEGGERAGMDVPDLLHLFEKTRGEQLDDDKLLLAA
mgnify:CR=1 FL=1